MSALRTRLQSVQDEIYNMIADVEADESRLSALRNALGDLMEISNWKRDSILSQARARELQPADAVPFGAWSIAYDRDGCRLLGQIKAPPPVRNPDRSNLIKHAEASCRTGVCVIPVHCTGLPATG